MKPPENCFACGFPIKDHQVWNPEDAKVTDKVICRVATMLVNSKRLSYGILVKDSCNSNKNSNNKHQEG